MNAIILAAGKGARMRSDKPKVLQVLSGKTLLEYVIDSAHKLCAKMYVVYGFGGEKVQQTIKSDWINWVEQAEQLGTGHAVMQALGQIEDGVICLILYGDVPLITQKSLQKLIAEAQKNSAALLTIDLENPTGYGRIVRQNGQIKSIVEEQDASDEQRAICEVNTGIMAFDSSLLRRYLKALDNDTAQGEFYLTDIIAIAVADGKEVASVVAEDEMEVAGVNDKEQLAGLERALQKKQAKQFMQDGLTLKDPSRFDCRGNFSFGKDCICDINVLIEGVVSLGNNTLIAPNCILKNAKIGNNVVILANTIIDGATIDSGATIGPFARIRPETDIGANAKIGNFVEVKKSIVGANSKISHLSYVGDTVMGKGVNIGAGVITCNYDGANKHQTNIEDGAFVGSGSQLIAPVVVGKNATIGAGSTISKNAPAEQLTLSRSKQTSLKNWNKPSKK
ncbi:MAG: UDP-N-acetylglucosamine diphosphorylase/glucosamine-1-phosphate N-acetyltransferase [Candidatus Thioglobus sp.]|nr:MAG: UDP-N-acetylglucosamine diphosphorylase/glucosamine-1-phosphate N-acetyltransferase [Candidatus Thioglobus sp.]